MSAAGAARGTSPELVARRRAARLAAVQALYAIELAGAPAEAVLGEFQAERWTSRRDGPDEALGEAPDREFLGEVVRGAISRQDEVDDLLRQTLAAQWPIERLEAVLRALLRAGTFELLARADVPARVVIAEYVRIAEDFFDGGEPGLANGVLDRLAKRLRPLEFAASGEPAGDR